MLTVSVVSGGFDPIHSGHVDYLHSARQLSDMLVVGVNSDSWLTRKKGRSFLPLSERLYIVSNLKPVDLSLEFNDDDGSAKGLIIRVREMLPKHKILFCNGGDRTSENIPEMDTSVDNIEFVFGVGGTNKKNSSSWILKNWAAKSS